MLFQRYFRDFSNFRVQTIILYNSKSTSKIVYRYNVYNSEKLYSNLLKMWVLKNIFLSLYSIELLSISSSCDNLTDITEIAITH